MTCKLLYLQPAEYLGIHESASVSVPVWTCIWMHVHVWLSLHLSSLQPASENCQCRPCGGEKIIIYRQRSKVFWDKSNWELCGYVRLYRCAGTPLITAHHLLTRVALLPSFPGPSGSTLLPIEAASSARRLADLIE